MKVYAHHLINISPNTPNRQHSPSLFIKHLNKNTIMAEHELDYSNLVNCRVQITSSGGASQTPVTLPQGCRIAAKASLPPLYDFALGMCNCATCACIWEMSTGLKVMCCSPFFASQRNRFWKRKMRLIVTSNFPVVKKSWNGPFWWKWSRWQKQARKFAFLCWKATVTTWRRLLRHTFSPAPREREREGATTRVPN